MNSFRPFSLLFGFLWCLTALILSQHYSAAAWSFHPDSKYRSNKFQTRKTSAKQSTLSMDVGESDLVQRLSVPISFPRRHTADCRADVQYRKLKIPRTPNNVIMNDEEESTPLEQERTTSLDALHALCPSDLTWKQFWHHQLDVMNEHLTDLKQLQATNLDGTIDFAHTHVASPTEEDAVSGTKPPQLKKNVDCWNVCLESAEFRKIRMTLYKDTVTGTHVFNSLWYPRYDYNLPLLGIDLLQFHHGKKKLCVADLQPIHSMSEDDNEDLVPQHAPYDHFLSAIQKDYPSLQGSMSKRFYDEHQFFSKHVLFGRLEGDLGADSDKSRLTNEASVVEQHKVLEAVSRYTDLYMEMMKQETSRIRKVLGSELPSSVEKQAQMRKAVAKGQQRYDSYSAARDPAIHMMNRVFGAEWADQFVHEFLFDRSREEQRK